MWGPNPHKISKQDFTTVRSDLWIDPKLDFRLETTQNRRTTPVSSSLYGNFKFVYSTGTCVSFEVGKFF